MHLFWVVVFCTNFTFKKIIGFLSLLLHFQKFFFYLFFNENKKKFLFAMSSFVTPAKKITLKTITYLKSKLFSTILPVLGTAFVHTLYFQLFKEKLKTFSFLYNLKDGQSLRRKTNHHLSWSGCPKRLRRILNNLSIFCSKISWFWIK